MRTRFEAVVISVALMLAVACGLTGGEPVSFPKTEPDHQATAVPAVEATMAASPTPTQAQSDQARSVNQGQYSMSQVRNWYDLMKTSATIWSLPELFGSDLESDLDEGVNRIELMVDNKMAVEKVQQVVEEELDRLGIPREAVFISVRQRPVPAP